MVHEIEVGEVKEDGLSLWCARLSLEYAKEEVKGLDDAVQRLKNRANSLIGWSVTIILALSAVFFTHSSFQFSLSVMLICMFLVAFFSVSTLYPISWKYTYINSDGMRDILNDFDTELDIIKSLTSEYEKHIDINVKIYKKLQNKMKWAWIIFFIAPLIGFVTQLFIKCFL